MLRNRLFNVLIAILLAMVIALTIREAVATAGVVSQDRPESRSSVACDSLPARHSIHNKYVEGLNAWVTYSEDGPTGIDGGLIELLSSYRTCSR